ncbi:MAG TPA: hypothetical protein VLG27_00235 [Candidatus Saccharimonadia bacterium]|nr:hypothetical protein [Candidatus Saccharimonadia bacterium]
MAKTTGSKAAKSTSKRPTRTAAKPRQLKPPKHQYFKLKNRHKHPAKLPSAWQLLQAAADSLWQNRRLFLGITLVYGLLNLILVQGLANSSDVNSLKQNLDSVFHGHFGSLGSSVSVFASLVGSAGNGSSPTAGAYQLFLAVITSLAVIWALRQIFAKAIPSVRDAYYQGMYPLIPFILVLLVICLQLIPFLLGAEIYSSVISNGIAISTPEKTGFALLFLILTLVSLYMAVSSLFALYVVTLPDMTLGRALRSGRELVRYRRWTVLRKIICLPIALVVVAAIIMVPIIVWITALASWVFFLLTMFSLVATHAYMYNLYRELLNE